MFASKYSLKDIINTPNVEKVVRESEFKIIDSNIYFEEIISSSLVKHLFSL